MSVCAYGRTYKRELVCPLPWSGAERHISSEIAMKRHGAYLDDKQHGRDLSAAEQIRQKDGGEE